MHALRGVALLAACAWIAPAGAPSGDKYPELGTFIESETERWAVIRNLGLRATESP